MHGQHDGLGGHAYSDTVILNSLCNLFHRSFLQRDRGSSFVELGGDSFKALCLSAACKRKGIHLPISAIFQAKSIDDLLLRAKLRPVYRRLCRGTPLEPCVNAGFGCQHECGLHCGRHRQLHCEILLPRSCSFVPSKVRICEEAQLAGINNVEEVDMTDMQLALITGGIKAPGKNVISFYQTYPAEDVPLLKRAWKTSIESEGIFRAVFSLSKDEGVMRKGNRAVFRWDEIETDIEEDYEKELQNWPAESSVGNSFKVVFLDRGLHGKSIATIVWRVHHALIDGYSASLLYKKVQVVLEGRQLQPNPSFLDVAARLHAHQALYADSSRQFWKDYMTSLLAADSEIALPMPGRNSGTNTVCHKTILFQVPMDQITGFAKSIGVTAATIFFSAWALVLSQYTNSDRVAFGIVCSGRDLPIPDIEATIGPLISTLPFCIELQGHSSAKAFIRSVFQRLTKLLAKQSAMPKDGSARKFSSALAFEYSMEPEEQCKVKPMGKSTFRVASDVPLSLSIGGDGEIGITYDYSRYHEYDLNLLAEEYRNGILALIDGEATLEDCSNRLMPEHCRQALLVAGNCHLAGTSSSSVRHDLVSLFQKTVENYGDHCAIQRSSLRLTYRDFSRSVNRLACRLSDLVDPGSVVCVYADRSVSWIIAIYAILMAGGVYAPLDPRLPDNLRDANYEIAAAKVFIAPFEHQKVSRPKTCNTCLSVEEVLNDEREALVSTYSPSHRVINPQAPAYICFTSGSTGKPKAVLCNHEGLVAFQSNLEVRLFSQPGVRIAQTMSPAFDGSIHEIFSTLSYGGTLVLADGADTLAHLTDVDCAILTPSVAKALDPLDYPRLKNVSSGLQSRFLELTDAAVPCGRGRLSASQ